MTVTCPTNLLDLEFDFIDVLVAWEATTLASRLHLLNLVTNTTLTAARRQYAVLTAVRRSPVNRVVVIVLVLLCNSWLATSFNAHVVNLLQVCLHLISVLAGFSVNRLDHTLNL